MRRITIALTVLLGTLPLWLMPGCSSAAPGEDVASTADTTALGSIAQHPSVDACGPVGAGMMRCHAKIRTDITNSSTPSGFGPSDLRSAYNLPSSGGAGQTVAVIDANDDPDAESDLAVYRTQYGLPACTTANGCFKKVNQSGVQGSYPAADAGWAGEIALDLDMVSAICPSCKIILVEATQATTADLGAAVNTAASLGATAISNSYGGSEDSTDTSSSTEYYNHPGILVTASAGDNGYGAEFPASSQYVLGVGGTSLVTSSSTRGWAESAWSDTGSGCSSVIAKPSFQHDTGCAKRTVADVSAIADPNTGVSVYVSYGGNGGWNVYGGTSVASPLIASVFALLGKTDITNDYPYANTTEFYDVTSGSNGTCSSSAPYLCKAGVGYDGPTGWGTPNGAALAAGSAPPPVSEDAGTTAPKDSGTTAPKDSGTAPPKDSGTTTEPDASAPKDSGAPSTCSHSICSTGSRLVSSCTTCATDVCAEDSYCCKHKWDSVCVSEVKSICGETCE
jgi:subtilase family serine protease